MSDDKPGAKRPEPVRVIDRRMFTPEGDRRGDGTAVEDSPAPAPREAPPPPPAAQTRGPAAPGPAPRPTVESAHFQSLVVNLARQAAANLGATRHPLTGTIEVDLEGAQQMIDLLQALRAKTQGNLTPDESELLEGLVADLQMQYVTVRSKSGKRP